MERFPAVVIGGPPHSGKSVLTYSLTQALREHGVQHYVVRAAPDGEGDWANEAAQQLVRTLRMKGDFSLAFTDFVCQSLAERHLPLLVDAGGRPTQEQERILDCCTHAILLTRDEAEHLWWQDLVRRHHLPVIADLTSDLHGHDRVTNAGPPLLGVISGLDRRQTAAGPVFQALVQCVAAVLQYDADTLYQLHESLCPVEIVISLARLARTLGISFEGDKACWRPEHLRRVLDYLPEATALGLYDRGPNWLYASVALLAAPAPFFHFDPRLGWVQAAALRQGEPPPHGALRFGCRQTPGYLYIDASVPAAHLDHDEFRTQVAPGAAPSLGIILGGKLPLWVYTSLALTYRAAPWVAVYQPQLDCAVVAYSADTNVAVGDCIYHLDR